MAYTGSSNYNSAVMDYYEPGLLKTAEGYLVASKFADRKYQTKGYDTIRANKILRPGKTTSPLSEGQLYGPDDAGELFTNYIDCELQEWGHSFGFSKKVKFASFIKDKDNRDVIANHFARSMEFQVIKMMTLGALWHRVDYDTNYEVNGSCDAGSDTGNAVDDALTQADNYWNGSMFTVPNADGPNYDQSRQVSTFTAASDKATFGTAFNHNLTTDSHYHLTSPGGLTSSDTLSTAALIRVAGMERVLETEPFRGGIYRAFIHADQENDLWSDSVFQNSAIYDNSRRFQNYVLGRWFNIEFMISSELYRMGTDGTYSATGDVYAALIFGRHSYFVAHWGSGSANNNIFGIDWQIVDRPDSQNLLGMRNWIGWQGDCAMTVLRSTSIIGLLTGATGLPVGGILT